MNVEKTLCVGYVVVYVYVTRNESILLGNTRNLNFCIERFVEANVDLRICISLIIRLHTWEDARRGTQTIIVKIYSMSDLNHKVVVWRDYSILEQRIPCEKHHCTRTSNFHQEKIQAIWTDLHKSLCSLIIKLILPENNELLFMVCLYQYFSNQS